MARPIIHDKNLDEGFKMNSLYDLQRLLRDFGTIIYTGDREGDLHLLEMEMIELRKRNLIDSNQFIIAKQIIANERSLLKE